MFIMSRHRYLLPLGVFLLAMLPVLRDAPGAQFTYLLKVDFQCNNGITTPGYSVYVAGARPELGNWDPAKAAKLAPGAYPTWAGTVNFQGANPGDEVEWKCIVRNENDPTDVKWQPDPNNKVTMAFSPVPKSVGAF
ncbi:carbohydrate-binding protein [Pseudomonas frederiksbergensis]|uniref:Carbohydrate-binding protein n=2 Tax=Pseudomonas frederiksbergensis TaxID=104087 RepID=A0A423KCK7_9PSED|nr:carbohydrate-binding protein [Pseudomonas frederiksbergensis]